MKLFTTFFVLFGVGWFHVQVPGRLVCLDINSSTMQRGLTNLQPHEVGFYAADLFDKTHSCVNSGFQYHIWSYLQGTAILRLSLSSRNLVIAGLVFILVCWQIWNDELVKFRLNFSKCASFHVAYSIHERYESQIKKNEISKWLYPKW